jgi:hypothetical protein
MNNFVFAFWHYMEGSMDPMDDEENEDEADY